MIFFIVKEIFCMIMNIEVRDSEPCKFHIFYTYIFYLFFIFFSFHSSRTIVIHCIPLLNGSLLGFACSIVLPSNVAIMDWSAGPLWCTIRYDALYASSEWLHIAIHCVMNETCDAPYLARHHEQRTRAYGLRVILCLSSDGSLNYRRIETEINLCLKNTMGWKATQQIFLASHIIPGWGANRAADFFSLPSITR